MTEPKNFELQVTEQDGVLIFHMIGRLMDQQTADLLMGALDKELAKGHKHVVLDMSRLQYMNSTGLNILINVLTRSRNAGGDALIAGISESVRQLFIVTKLDSVFVLAKDIPAAISSIKA